MDIDMRPKFCVDLYKKKGKLFASYRFYTFDPSTLALESHDWDVDDRRIRDKGIDSLFKIDKDEALYRLNKREYYVVCFALQEMLDHSEQDYSAPPVLSELLGGQSSTRVLS